MLPHFQDLLVATGPAPDAAPEIMQFGRFVGGWDLDIVFYAEDGSVKKRTPGEWHFGWILEGRAVADVWIVPPRVMRPPGLPPPGEYGMSVRFFDREIGAWRSTWLGPVHRVVLPFVARESGDELVLERRDERHRMVRWIFSQITPTSFHWRNIVSADEGQNWHLEQEMFATRAHE